MKSFSCSKGEISLLTAAAAAGTLIFPYVEIYLRNRDFFALSPWGAFLFGAVGYLTFLAAGFSILFCFRKTRFFSIVNAFLMSSGITILLQYLYWSSCFPEKVFASWYSSEMLLLTCFHLFCLLLPITIAIYFSQFCCRHAKELALIILLTQAVSIAAAFPNNGIPSYDFTEYSISEKTKFEFANKENIIVLVVDAMGERICKETMAKFPELKEVLHDFTCFDRMVSPIPKTMYAVPAILTGIEYVQKEKESEDDHAVYLNTACHAPNSIFQGLKRCGFRTEGYPFILQTISYSPDVIDNSTRITYQVQKQSAIKILDIALNRIVPFFIKPLLEDYYYFATDQFVTPQDSEITVSDDPLFDISFYKTLEKEFRIGNHEKVFKYLHIHGAHDPVRTDEFLKRNRETSKLRQLRGSLKIVESLLEKLKAAKLYDDSMIIIIGDHTEFYTPENIAFIKRKQEHNKVLRYNSIPCKVTDIAATVLKESSSVSGLKSLFDISPLWSSGDCRQETQMPNLTFTPWEKTNALPIDDFELYSRPHWLEGNKILIAPDYEFIDQIQHKTLLLKNVVNGDSWKSRSISLKGNFRFLETPPLNLPDGVYQLFLQIQENPEYTVDIIQSLPKYLVIAAGTYQWTSTPPDQPARPMYIGEEIKIRPMHSYPQIEFRNGSEFRKDSVTFKQENSLKVHLPALQKDTDLIITLKQQMTPKGEMFVREGNRILVQCPIDDETNKTVCVIPLAQGPEKYLNLDFEFIPKRFKRDTLYKKFYFQIQDIHLKEPAKNNKN